MGNAFTRIWHSLFGDLEKRVVVLGIDGAGKTSILMRMKLGEMTHTMPTIGFNVETVTFNNVQITAWDIGGQQKIRQLWKHYFDYIDAVIFVVDSNDVERMGDRSNIRWRDEKYAEEDNTEATAVDELHKVLADARLERLPLLVFANKSDLPNAKTVNVAERMGLHHLKNRDWHVQPSNGLLGDGLVEGMTWLADKLKRQRRPKT